MTGQEIAQQIMLTEEAEKITKNILAKRFDNFDQYQEVNKINDPEIAKAVIKRLLDRLHDNKQKHFVIAIDGTSDTRIASCPSEADAIRTANDWLREHIREIGREKDFDNFGEYENWCSASSEYPRAWCNWHGDWGAYIVKAAEAKEIK